MAAVMTLTKTLETSDGLSIKRVISSFLAQQPDLLSKFPHIPVLTVCPLV